MNINIKPLTIDMIDALIESNEIFFKKYNLINDALDYLVPSKEYLFKLKKEMIENKDLYPLAVDHIIILDDKIVIGSIYFKYLPVLGVSEIGYGMNSKYEGHGYMTKAVKLLFSFGYKNNIKVVKADTNIENKKSQNVLLRCGFEIERMDEKNIYFIKKLENTNEE